jgi:hypothetical protein
MLVADEVRGCLDVQSGTEDEPRRGDGGRHLLQVRVRRVHHLRFRLCAEVLDDDFREAVVLAGHLADREDRVGAFGERLADADEDTGRERDAGAPRVLEDPETDFGILVRAAKVRAAFVLVQAVAVVSSIMPMDGATGLRRWKSCQVSTPGLRCGSRPVSSRTRIAMART